MRHEQYAAIDAVNFSTLKAMADSPAAYRYRCEHEREDSTTMLFGRAVHCAVLEPDRFPLDYVVWDGGTRRGKAWDEFADVNAARSILKADEYAAVLRCRDAVMANEQAARILGAHNAQREVVITWTDAATGVDCKARLDHLADFVTDLKTTSTVDAHDFGRRAATMHLHAQLAFYTRAAESIRHDVGLPHIIAVEQGGCCDVGVFRLPPHVLAAGNALIDDWLYKLTIARRYDEWPGRYSGINDLDFPTWALEDPTADGWGDLPVRRTDT